MENPQKFMLDKLLNHLRYMIHRPLKLVGMCRFDMDGDTIVSISKSSILFCALTLLILNYCTLQLCYQLVREINYLNTPEIMVYGMFDVFHTLVLSNLIILNRDGITEFLNSAIEIDRILGFDRTEFIRKVSYRTYSILAGFSAINHMIILATMYVTYIVPKVSTMLAGGIFGCLLFFIYYDLAFFVTLYTFLSLRVRYLNIALMKLTDINTEYLPTQYPFSSLFWHSKYDDIVENGCIEIDNIIKMYKMLFKQLRCLEKSYRWTILMLISYIFVGTLIVVQNIINYIKSTDMDVNRLLVLIFWAILSWICQIAMTQQADIFPRQIKQTHLICTFVQLTAGHPREIYKLTKSIIRTLNLRDAKVSIYGMFYYDTALLLRMAASLFVYITIQLQFAFPKNWNS